MWLKAVLLSPGGLHVGRRDCFFFFSHPLQLLYLSHLTTMGLKSFLVLVLVEEKGA